MEFSPDVIQTTVSSVVANGAGDTVWVIAITDQSNELPADDEHATTVNASKIRVVDIVKGQRDDPTISRVLQLLRSNTKRIVNKQRRESNEVQK